MCFLSVLGNVAVGKTATAASVLYPQTPERAIDGQPGDLLSEGSCYQSAMTREVAWWMVDLGAPHVIYKVIIQGEQHDQSMYTVVNDTYQLYN